MTAADGDEREIVLADLELTRGLTIQMTAIGMLGLVVSVAVLGARYQAVSGQPAAFEFAAGVGWWTTR